MRTILAVVMVLEQRSKLRAWISYWVSEKEILKSERRTNANTLYWSFVSLVKELSKKGQCIKMGSSRKWNQRGSHEQNKVELCKPVWISAFIALSYAEMPLKSYLEDSLYVYVGVGWDGQGRNWGSVTRLLSHPWRNDVGNVRVEMWGLVGFEIVIIDTMTKWRYDIRVSKREFSTLSSDF